MGTIAIFGATGAVGKSVADALRVQGTAYRAVGRNREKLTQEFGSDALTEIVAWNPDDPASVRAAARGVETIVYLVGVPYNRFELHPVAMRQTLDGAIAEGVRNFVLIGTVYPYGCPTTATVAENHPRQPNTHKGKMRKEQEDILMAAQADGKIHATILRLPDFYGPGVETSFLTGTFKAAVTGGTADMLGPIDTPHEFVYVPDVGPAAVALANTPAAYGRDWNFAGDGATTQRAMAEKAFALAGHKPKLRVAGLTLLKIMGLFNPVMRELVEMNYLLTTPVLMNDDAIHNLLGDVRKTSYDDGIKATLEYYRKHAA